MDIDVALIGLFGVIIGSIITVLGNVLSDYFKNQPKKLLDKKRQEMLKEMLEKDPAQWRSLSTLSSVVGADHSETKRLLIAIGARGSETNNDVWALIKHNPLPTSDDGCI